MYALLSKIRMLVIDATTKALLQNDLSDFSQILFYSNKFLVLIIAILRIS